MARSDKDNQLAVLRILQDNNQITMSEIASRIGISQSQVSKIAAKLRREYYIRNDRSILNPQKFGLSTLAFIQLALKEISQSEIEETVVHIMKFQNVQEIHHV